MRPNLAFLNTPATAGSVVELQTESELDGPRRRALSVLVIGSVDAPR